MVIKQLDMYRGITLSPVLSKLLEIVLLHLFEESLTRWLFTVQIQTEEQLFTCIICF